MAKNKISIKGVKRLQKHLKQAATMDDVKDVVRLNTAEMQQKAQRKAPVDTGALKRYIMLSILDDGLRGRVNSLMNYASYVEYGTRFMYGRKYMGGAYNEQKYLFRQDLERLMK